MHRREGSRETSKTRFQHGNHDRVNHPYKRFHLGHRNLEFKRGLVKGTTSN